MIVSVSCGQHGFMPTSPLPERVISHRAVGKYTQVQVYSIWLQFLNNWIYTLIYKGSLEFKYNFCVFQTGVSIVLPFSDSDFTEQIGENLTNQNL